MEAIKNAIQCLKNATTSQMGKKDIEDAITQISSIVRLLELSSASAVTFLRLTEILRKHLLPLYRACLTFALDLVVAVCLFLHNNLHIPALQSANPEESWERLLVALLSGILDFLDENSNNKIHETVALALYPVLCPSYFCGPSHPSLDFSGELLSVVYQAIIATIDSYSKHTARLRDLDIGSIRLGYTISQTKDFLALESILDLLGLLIPPLKEGRDRRARFIKEVFDPALFKHASNRIIQHLESISSPDWSIVSEKIVGVLAEYDISFPQPFKTSAFALNGRSMESSPSLYVDMTQFIANVDKDGKIETLYVSFSTVLDVAASPSAKGEVHVVIRITKPPLLGNEPMLTMINDDMQISFNMKYVHINHFGRALRGRNINLRQLWSRKLSKGQPIEFDFASQNKDLLILTQQERLQEVSQNIYTSPQPPEYIPQANEHSESLSSTKISGHPGGSLGKQPARPQDTIKRRPKLKETRLPDSPIPLRMPVIHTQAKGNHQRTYENEGLNPHSSTSRVMRKRNDCSDDADKNVSEDNLVTQTAIDVEASSEPAFWKVSASSSEMSRRHSMLKSVDPLSSKHNFEPDSSFALKAKKSDRQVPRHNMGEKEPPLLPERSRGAIKRPAKDIEVEETEVVLPGKRPNKRAREQSISLSPTKSIRPYFRKQQYGRKGRNSSPALRTSMKIDFDEVPLSKVSNKVEALASIDLNKRSALATKRRNVQAVPRAKLREKKKGVEVSPFNMDTVASKEKGRESKEIIVSADKIAPSVNVTCESHFVKGTRQSSRVSKLQSKATGKPVEKPLAKKSIKAPWEITFQEKNEPFSDPVALISGPTEDLTDNLSSKIKTVHLNDMAVDTNIVAERYAVSLHGDMEHVEHGSSEPEKRDLVIDLTNDASPAKSSREVNNMPLIAHIRNAQSMITPKARQEVHQEMSLLGMKKQMSVSEEDQTCVTSNLEPPKNRQNGSPRPEAYLALSEIPETRTLSNTVQSSVRMPETKIEKFIVQPLSDEDKDADQLAVQIKVKSDSLVVKTPPRHSTKVYSESPEQLKYYRPRTILDNTKSDKSRVAIPIIPIQRRQYRKRSRGLEPQGEPMGKIVEILHQINDAVVHRIESRFNAVTEGLHIGQRIILEGTANSLQAMQRESNIYFNDMVDLEEQYTLHCSRIASGVDDFIKSNEQLSQCFKDIIADHHRRSLSKKLPTILFHRIPAIISNTASKL